MDDEAEEHSGTGPDRIELASSRLVRGLLMVGGTFFLVLGLIGIALPILPTTPFLLLAAFCYARSSKRFYDWLLNHRWFGEYIRDYQEGRGIPLKAKVMGLSLLWFTIMLSVVFFVPIFYVDVILIIIAMLVSAHILHLPTKS